MTARLIDGRAVAERTLAEVAGRVERCRSGGVVPCLAVILVGGDPASQIYVRNKGRKAEQVGIATRDLRFGASDVTTASLRAVVAELNADPEVHGILIQLPLPEHVDARAVLGEVSAAKDVDGFHPENLGRLMTGEARFVACTPQGCMLLLESAGVDLRGASAVVVGRSTIVGKPMAQLLLDADATVTIAHSRTRDLESVVRASDVVVAAVGRAKLIEGDWIRPGAAVIDVGMNRDDAGKLCGDVDFDGAKERAACITPVPGGVGPMTIACLMRNVTLGAEAAIGG